MIDIIPELKTSQINRIYGGLAKDTKLAKKIMDHICRYSKRVYTAEDLLRSGTSMFSIMNKGQW